MNLSKADERGTSKVLYDKQNEVLAVQWVDSKVVSCTSTLEVSGKVPVSRRSGADVLNLEVEKALRAYQDGMDAVDRGDQYREGGGGFASKAHYKKWYKKAYFAVLDFMLLNSFFAWNMAAEDDSLNRLQVKKFAFYAAVAEEMISYKDGEDEDSDSRSVQDGHIPKGAKKADRNYCVVCKLEEKWRKEEGKKDQLNKSSRSQDHMVVCEECQLHAHNVVVDHDRKIFELEQFRGKSCWEIMHSSHCKGLWKMSNRVGGMAERKLPGSEHDGSARPVSVKAQSYAPRRSHAIYKQLAESYGRGQETRKRPHSNVSGEGDGNNE